jgi:hypothetical protein
MADNARERPVRPPGPHERVQHVAGDPLPAPCELIEIRVAELKQLFNAIDPSPFREKDLDQKAEEFIVGWAREAHRDVPLALVVYLDRPAGMPDEAAALRDAVHEFFAHRRDVTRRQLSQLFRNGRISLLIGISFLAVSIAVGDLLASRFADQPIGGVLSESLLIGGWVAMWRPLEVFLYDWWPIRAEVRLSDRLAGMPVRIVYTQDSASEIWRADWPAVAAAATARSLT